MQTKLRIVNLFAASLLWASLISAATQRATATRVHQPKHWGLASWYGKEHQGRKMANGQRFDRRKLTAASWSVPLGAKIRVVNVANGRSVVVTVTDRGPNHRLHRILDLSEAAANQLGYATRGLAPVVYSPAEIAEPAEAQLSAQLIAPARDEIITQAETLPYPH